ncbi:MAG: ABC transporter substrate-binding protein [Halobacteriales archaeon]|nr:ABC transporter substrate-binding protein [Halobacteriales archaeon]
MQRAAVPISALLLTIVVLAGCLGNQGGKPGGGSEAVFTTATIGEPESLDPAYDYETAGGTVLQNVCDTLVFYNKDSAVDLVPVLVTEVPTKANSGLSADGLTYTFHLKPNVKFHDGNTLTADDVKFSLDRTILMNDPNSAAWISGSIKGASAFMASKGTAQDRQTYLAAKGVEVVDPSTVRIHLEKADAAFLYKISFTQASILSSKAYKGAHSERNDVWGAAQTDDGLPPIKGDKPITRDAWADRNLVCTGPFMLERWIPGDSVILKKFVDYHAGDGMPAPSMDRVVIKKVEDLNTRILMLQNHQADDIYVAVSDLHQVQGKDFAKLQEDPSFATGVLAMTYHITDNNECPTDGQSNAKDCDFFSDLHMRKVFSAALDYQKFVNDVAKGHITQLNSAVPKGMFGADTSITPYKLDMTLAKAELALSKHPNGFKVNIYFNSGNALREGAAQLLKQGLEQLGQQTGKTIQVQVQPLDWSTALLPKGKAGAVAAYFIGWAPDYAFPDDYVLPFGHSQLGTYPKYVRLVDPHLDTLINAALNLTDQTQLVSSYQVIQRYMHDNVLFLWLYQTNNVHVQGSWVCGYFFNPMDSGQPNVGHYQYMSNTGNCPGATPNTPPASGSGTTNPPPGTVNPPGTGSGTTQTNTTGGNTTGPPPAGGTGGNATGGNTTAGNTTGGNTTGNATGG